MRLRTTVWVVMLALLPLPLGLAGEEDQRISLEKVRKQVADDEAALVDVREQREWDEGHVADAIFLPLSQLTAALKDESLMKKLTDQLPDDKVLYTYCRSGVRSARAADILEELGYSVKSLNEGYRELVQFGFPHVKPQEAPKN